MAGGPAIRTACLDAPRPPLLPVLDGSGGLVIRVEVFGWGIVAPGAPDVDAFARLLERGETALERFDGFGADNFRVGRPELRFGDYRAWIEARFSAARYD